MSNHRIQDTLQSYPIDMMSNLIAIIEIVLLCCLIVLELCKLGTYCTELSAWGCRRLDISSSSFVLVINWDNEGSEPVISFYH